MNFFGSKQQSNVHNNSNPSNNDGTKSTNRVGGNVFFPNFSTQMATPTTAVSSNSYAMGTTGITSENVISQMKAMHEPAEQQQSSSISKPGIITTPAKDDVSYSSSSDTSRQVTSSSTTTTNSNVAKANSLHPMSVSNKSANVTNSATTTGPGTDIPRGKLEVTIVEAKNLFTISNDSEPVSYTHLDVYKRQIYALEKAWNMSQKSIIELIKFL